MGKVFLPFWLYFLSNLLKDPGYCDIKPSKHFIPQKVQLSYFCFCLEFCSGNGRVTLRDKILKTTSWRHCRGKSRKKLEGSWHLEEKYSTGESPAFTAFCLGTSLSLCHSCGKNSKTCRYNGRDIRGETLGQPQKLENKARNLRKDGATEQMPQIMCVNAAQISDWFLNNAWPQQIPSNTAN